MKNEEFRVEKLSGKTKSFKKRLSGELRAYTQAKVGPFRFKEFSLSLKGKGGKWAGGLIGCTYWNIMFIDTLWVDRKYRARDWAGNWWKGPKRKGGKRNAPLPMSAPIAFRRRGFTEKWVIKFMEN